MLSTYKLHIVPGSGGIYDVKGSVYFVPRFGLPHFPPLPSMAQISKQALHCTFDIINTSLPFSCSYEFVWEVVPYN